MCNYRKQIHGTKKVSERQVWKEKPAVKKNRRNLHINCKERI